PPSPASLRAYRSSRPGALIRSDYARSSAARLVAPAHGLLVAHALLSVLAGPDADRLLDVVHEHAPIADRTRAGRRHDRLDGVVDQVGRHHGLHLDLRQQRDVRHLAAVLLGVAFLPAAADHLAHREARHAELVERVLHLLEPFVPDDRFDLLHLDLALLELRHAGLRDGGGLARRPTPRHRRGTVLRSRDGHERLGVAPHAVLDDVEAVALLLGRHPQAVHLLDRPEHAEAG